MEKESKNFGENLNKEVSALPTTVLMNEDNKKMLGKIAQTKTSQEAFKTLMKDPDTERPMSYMESRMRFG